MEMEKKQSDNKVLIIGKIQSIYPTGKSKIVTIRVAARGPQGASATTYPKVYCMNADNTGIDDFFVEDKVQITGHLVNSRRTRPNGTVFYSQAIIVDKVEKNQSLFETELGVSGWDGMGMQPATLVYLHGEVEKIEQTNPNAINIRLNAIQAGHNNHINVTTFNRDTLMIAPGDTISIWGRVSTKRVVRDNVKRYYQNIVAQKIVKEYQVAEADNE